MTTRGYSSAARSAAVGLMLAAWLMTMLAGVSPALHRLLHHDSPNPHHECLATQLAKSQVLTGAATGIAPRICVSSGEPASRADPVLPFSEDTRLSPSRAPPAVCAPAGAVG